MSTLTDLQATRENLRELSQIMTRTRQILARMIRQHQSADRTINQTSGGQLSDPLEHMGAVREGFILSQRTGERVSISVLRDMVRDIITDWAWLEDLNLTITPSDEPEHLHNQLIAYNHALIALAILPSLPADAITFPQSRRSYQDLYAPDEPESLLKRIEEIEQTLYQAEMHPVKDINYNRFRRTYAFFEASSWLARNHLGPLLSNSHKA